MNNNQYLRNYKYAPGIATYGAAGKEGLPGENGKGCFFCTYNLNVSEELQIVNRKIQNNELLSEYKMEVLSRQYQEKDIVIDCTGSVYAISVIDPSTNSLGINASNGKIGEFSKSSDEEYFELSDLGRLFNIKGNGVDIIRTSSENPASILGAESNYVQRIYSDIPDNDSEYKMTSLVVQDEGTNHEFNIAFNKNDKAFHLTSDSPIVLDCSVLAVSDNSSEYSSIDEYSKVPTQEDNISKVYNLYRKMSWTYSSNVLTIDTSKVKDHMNKDMFRPNELVVHIVKNIGEPIKKYSVPVQWADGKEYEIGDQLSYDLTSLGDFHSMRVSFIKNIEVYIPKK